MRKSIQNSIILFVILVVVIVYITTIILASVVIDIHNIFNIVNISILSVFVLISAIFSNLLSRIMTVPLKKIEKSMKTVAEGKIPETSKLNEYIKFSELSEFIDAYTSMMEVIKKNHFDLNSQDSKTEIIIEHMADGVVAFSVTGHVVHMNKSAMRLLGLTSNEDTFSKISSKLNIEADFDKIMYLPNFKSIETKTTLEDSIINLVFAPFFSDNLTPMGVIMVIRDVTENMRLDNMRKEFVANVSHELKTPLTSIKGYSETIMNGDLTYQETLRFSRVINQEANRMDRLVRDLLQLSRFDSKKVTWKKVQFSLNDLARNVCEKMKYSAREKNHNLEYVVAGKPPEVYADRDSIEQVIMNIISNSIKYTPEGGEIRVYVGTVNDSAYIKFVDNGIGIPEKDLRRIFERFYRVDKARSRKMGGTGLGLAIVKEIIDGNNGTIDINSTVNVGTEVVVTLPTKKTM